jgi:tRNA threonylcarbamoyladenosine biosynthesis protein TsaE
MAERERIFLTRSAAETEELGRALGERLTPGAVVALQGELGSGKTTFVRGLARGLGVESLVRSPTFTLMQEHAGRCPFFHFDAWMSGREEVFLQGGGAEYLGGAGVAAVEWAERVSAWLPEPRLEVRLEHHAPGTREVQIALCRALASERPSRLEEQLAQALAALPEGPPDVLRG